MTRRLVFRPEAEADLAAAVAFYEAKRPGLGRELLAAMDRALATIEDAPGAQPWLQHGHPCHKYTIGRFPCLILFTEAESAVTIVAVAQAKRGPGAWER